jgi:hypothetical protein
VMKVIPQRDNCFVLFQISGESPKANGRAPLGSSSLPVGATRHVEPPRRRRQGITGAPVIVIPSLDLGE